MKKFTAIIFVIFVIGLGYFIIQKNKRTLSNLNNQSESTPSVTTTFPNTSINPLAISTMKQKPYLGSNLYFETTLTSGSNFNRYIVSYKSDGLKQYGLLTIPNGQIPSGGWPVILFNHGYISPSQYSTESSYDSFVNLFATSGYIVFKPDYRGNGNSDGSPVQIYVSPDYLTDSMNALSSIKQYKDTNPQKIGVFGHSMGGNITLHELVISQDFKAASIMSGVVGDETSIVTWWNDRIAAKSITGNDLDTSYLISQLLVDHGPPSSNPDYWNSIDPTKYIADISAPVQILVGTADLAVPPSFSLSLRDVLLNAAKIVDYHEYIGADHNLSPYTSAALTSALTFFDKYLK